MPIRDFPPTIDADQIDFVRDPRKTNTTRLFDDFLGGGQNTNAISQFHVLGNTGGAVWNNNASTDTFEPTGFDDFGTLQAETGTSTTSRSIMMTPQLFKSSPDDGDRWMWEVRVKPDLVTGNGFLSMSILRSDSTDSYVSIDGSPITNNVPRMSVFADFDEAKWQTHKSDSTASQAGTTAASSIDFTDSSYARLAALVEYQSAGGGRYAVKFYIDGVEAFSDRITAGSGSPFGKCILYNNGTGSVLRSTFDWSLIQFTRTDAVEFVDIESV